MGEGAYALEHLFRAPIGKKARELRRLWRSVIEWTVRWHLDWAAPERHRSVIRAPQHSDGAPAIDCGSTVTFLLCSSGENSSTLSLSESCLSASPECEAFFDEKYRVQ
jgi:hypothetical protein